MLRRLLLNAKNMGKQIVVVDNDYIYTDYEFPSAEELKSTYGTDVTSPMYKFFRDTDCIDATGTDVLPGGYTFSSNAIRVCGKSLYARSTNTLSYTLHTQFIKPFTGSKYDI